MVNMNKQQKKYAVERVTRIQSDKIKEIDDECKRKELCANEKWQLIRDGKVKMKPISQLYSDEYLYNCYDFSAFEQKEHREAERKQRIKKVMDRANALRDEIMLGDRIDLWVQIEINKFVYEKY